MPHPESSTPTRPAPTAVNEVVGDLFRRESGRLVALLTRYFGVGHLHLVEDAVQDALLLAMTTWPHTGIPARPTAWLMTTARHRALDAVRRDTRRHWHEPELVPVIEDDLLAALSAPAPMFEEEVQDSRLRMMFVCCHPGLSASAQIALTLRTLCGFGEREIAAAFLEDEATVTKRLVRARQFLRRRRVRFDLPPAAHMVARVEVLLHTLYLLFSEGYKASHGEAPLRADLCAEAVRLGGLLLRHPAGDRPETHALMALMHFNQARLPGRLGDDGGLLLLAAQDRGRWDAVEIGIGLQHLDRAAAGRRLTRYHLEAGIAACHCLARDFASTDWRRIVSLYDRLLALDGSPVVALNRAVALARIEGPAAGLRALAKIRHVPALRRYHLLPAAEGLLHFEAGDMVQADRCFRLALELATLPAERTLLETRLAQCVPGGPQHEDGPEDAALSPR